MEDALLVGVVDRLGDTLHVARGLRRGQGAVANELRQVLSLDVIHREEVLPGGDVPARRSGPSTTAR